MGCEYKQRKCSISCQANFESKGNNCSEDKYRYEAYYTFEIQERKEVRKTLTGKMEARL